MAHNQIDQITVLKNIINSNNDQNKILQAEIDKLEKSMSLSKLSIRLDKKTLVYGCVYATSYSTQELALSLVPTNQNTEGLLDLLFDDNKDNDTYKYIHDTKAFNYSTQYDILRLTRVLYKYASTEEERDRLREIYNIIATKNTAVADFINAQVPTTEIVDAMVEFYEKCDVCRFDKPSLDKKLAVLSFAVSHNIMVDKANMHKEIVAEIKKWLDQSYACWYTIEQV